MRRSSLLGALCAVLAFPALAVSAAAQTAAPASPFIIDRSRSDRVQPPPAAAAPSLPPPAPDNRLAAIKAFALTGVRIQGASLAPDILGAAARGFIGRTVDAKDLTAIAQRVSDAYVTQGDIAFYTVTVPEQDFAQGILTLAVTEGYIEHVDLKGDVSGDVGRAVALADKLTHERPLRRSTLQRYLSLIRDLPGLTIAPQLLRGDTAGAVRLVLTLTQKGHALSLNINDGGNALLGRTQMEADLSFYNLLREGEETKLSFGTSTIISRYQYYGLSHSEALDDEGTRGTLSYGYLRTDVGSLDLSGAAQTLQLAVAHPLIRSFDENLTVTGSLDGINSANALLGTLLANEHVRALRASAGYSLGDPVSTLALSANFSQGLDFGGARSTTGDTQFQKMVLQGGYSRSLDDDWLVQVKAVTQLASQRLPISELYALGGPDFGRAFLAASALGDSALAGSLEIDYRINWLPEILTGSKLFVTADDGWTWYHARAAAPAFDAHLASAGVGIRVPVGAKVQLEVEAANALAANAPGTYPGSWRFLFGLTGSF